MNAWNSDFVKQSYDTAALGHITATEGLGVRVNPAVVGNAFRQLVQNEGASPTADATLNRAKELAREQAKTAPKPTSLIQKLTQPGYGYVALWLSELGKTVELDGVLKYADEHLQPTWENGGLFYPRNDVPANENLDWTHMDPFTGNAAIGHARLNVPDGQKKMYEAPWTRQSQASKPWVSGVELGSGVDFLRGAWDADGKCLVLTMKTWDGQKRSVKPVIENLSDGTWTVYVNGEATLTRSTQQGNSIELELEVDGEELDLLVVGEK